MSFISKTLRDKVISSNVWTLWILETLDIVSPFEFWRKLKISFISKTVQDGAISSSFLTIRILEIFGILPLKNVKFRPPSSILSEIENVGYLKNL